MRAAAGAARRRRLRLVRFAVRRRRRGDRGPRARAATPPPARPISCASASRTAQRWSARRSPTAAAARPERARRRVARTVGRRAASAAVRCRTRARRGPPAARRSAARARPRFVLPGRVSRRWAPASPAPRRSVRKAALAPPPSSAGTPAAKMPCSFSALRFSLIAHPLAHETRPGRRVTASPTGEPFHPRQGSIVCGITRPGSTPGGFRSGRPAGRSRVARRVRAPGGPLVDRGPHDGPVPVAQGGRCATRAEGVLRDRASLARRPVARFTGFHSPAEQAGARRRQAHLHHREPGELPARAGVAPRRLDGVGLHVRAVGPDGRNQLAAPAGDVRPAGADVRRALPDRAQQPHDRALRDRGRFRSALEWDLCQRHRMDVLLAPERRDRREARSRELVLVWTDAAGAVVGVPGRARTEPAPRPSRGAGARKDQRTIRRPDAS